MKIREFLQIELWSKETSRKILVRTRKVLTRVGIALSVVVLLLGSALVVEMDWLTTGERNVGRSALAEIDGLQNLGSARDKEFDWQYKKAHQKVESAESVVRTLRDKFIADMLSLYLYDFELDREMAEKETKFRASMQQRNLHWRPNPETDKKIEELKTQTKQRFSSELHRLLN